MSGSNKDSENEARVAVGCSGQGFTGRLLVCTEQPEWSEGETNRSVSKKKACAAPWGRAQAGPTSAEGGCSGGTVFK